jgi:hypothetical protein
MDGIAGSTNGGTGMTAAETVALYYDGWQNRQGDHERRATSG